MATADTPTPSPHQDAAWARIKALFLETIDVAQEDRARWLDEACGTDAGLRREIESLLASDREAGSFCETPAAALPGADGVDRFAPRLPPGTRLGPYEILAFIGAGGMGEVYRARDARDARDVAIKTVNAALAHPAGEWRLLREARHASTLRHPNICAIHEVGEADGIAFIAMEFVDGRPLSVIQRGGPLALDRVLAYGSEIAGALDHAHRHGLVHRDLKQSNVVIGRAGRAVVLDFGLAARLPAEDGAPPVESLTASGQGPAGTLTHMAPEVLLGARADARADVWALGVLLYEMATGELPFTGRTPFETSAAILAEPAKPMPRRLPLALRLVIGRCLEKDPRRRYQRAADVRDALGAVCGTRRWPLAARLLAARRSTQRRAGWAALALIAAGAASLYALRPADPPIRAVAVMPFAHGTAPGDQAYAEGIAEAIAARLGATAAVRVVSGASIAPNGTSAAEAGRALGADGIVTGTLRRGRDGLELDLRLVDASRGVTRWSQTFTRNARDVLVLEADAVRALAAGLDAALTPAARERLTLVPAVRPDVYEAYLRGRYEWNQRTAGSLERAVAQFERAIALDPAFAPAHARLADCYNLLGTVMVGSGSPLTYRPRAEGAAIKALQIDPDLAEAHAALGYVRHYTWQWADAEQSFLRAIELNPSAPLPRLWYANLLMSRARFDEALRQAYAARDLDPFSLVVHTNIGWIELYAGQTGASIATLRRAVALDPSYPQAHWRLAGSLAAAGRAGDALAEVETVLRLTGRSPSSLILSAQILADVGRVAEARRTLAEVMERARTGYVSPGMMPGTYAALGDVDQAVAWMERAYGEQANAVAYFAVDPDMRALRGDARYLAMLQRVGLSGVQGR